MPGRSKKFKIIQTKPQNVLKLLICV